MSQFMDTLNLPWQKLSEVIFGGTFFGDDFHSDLKYLITVVDVETYLSRQSVKRSKDATIEWFILISTYNATFKLVII